MVLSDKLVVSEPPRQIGWVPFQSDVAGAALTAVLALSKATHLPMHCLKSGSVIAILVLLDHFQLQLFIAGCTILVEIGVNTDLYQYLVT